MLPINVLVLLLDVFTLSLPISIFMVTRLVAPSVIMNWSLVEADVL